MNYNCDQQTSKQCFCELFVASPINLLTRLGFAWAETQTFNVWSLVLNLSDIIVKDGKKTHRQLTRNYARQSINISISLLAQLSIFLRRKLL